ncbi:MAG: hypothetical protein HQL05_00085 [Nitrospirae bacterium]|nr:hypothetical protein [Nitrospirota bacterium]
MPIVDFPFTDFGDGMLRLSLLARIINPHTKSHVLTRGIIDTGADECAIPGDYAPNLKHNLQQGQSKQISTANGENTAYRHTTVFQILHPCNRNILYESSEIMVDFMPNLDMLLFGVNNFPSNFILTVDYPKRLFSLRFPAI